MRKSLAPFLSAFLLLSAASVVWAQAASDLGDYQHAKSKYLKTVDLYQKGRQDFLKAKEDATRLHNAQGQQNLLEAAKKHLKNSLNTIIRHLEVLRKRVENAPGIGEDTKTKLLAEIDADISFLQGKLATVDEISSIDEVRDLGKTVRDYWLKTRGRSKAIVGHILAARFSHFIERLKNVSERLHTEVEKLQAQGVDTSQIEALLADFDKNLALAEEKYTAAVSVFDSISNPADANELFSEGHNLLKEARGYLQQAHHDLREAVAELKVLVAANRPPEASGAGRPQPQ
jgi:tetratricopeptide (TPR) repeat protein